MRGCVGVRVLARAYCTVHPASIPYTVYVTLDDKNGSLRVGGVLFFKQTNGARILWVCSVWRERQWGESTGEKPGQEPYIYVCILYIYHIGSKPSLQMRDDSHQKTYIYIYIITYIHELQGLRDILFLTYNNKRIYIQYYIHILSVCVLSAIWVGTYSYTFTSIAFYEITLNHINTYRVYQVYILLYRWPTTTYWKVTTDNWQLQFAHDLDILPEIR